VSNANVMAGKAFQVGANRIEVKGLVQKKQQVEPGHSVDRKDHAPTDTYRYLTLRYLLWITTCIRNLISNGYPNDVYFNKVIRIELRYHSRPLYEIR